VLTRTLPHSYSLLFDGLRSRLVSHKPTYGGGAVYVSVLWIIYPVCWAFGEGANVLTLDHEMIFYSILDIFAGPVFLFFFLATLRSDDYDDYGLQSGKASDYVGTGVGTGARRTEKAEEAGTA